MSSLYAWVRGKGVNIHSEYSRYSAHHPRLAVELDTGKVRTSNGPSANYGTKSYIVRACKCRIQLLNQFTTRRVGQGRAPALSHGECYSAATVKFDNWFHPLSSRFHVVPRPFPWRRRIKQERNAVSTRDCVCSRNASMISLTELHDQLPGDYRRNSRQPRTSHSTAKSAQHAREGARQCVASIAREELRDATLSKNSIALHHFA